MSNIRYARMKRCFWLLREGNVVRCGGNSIYGATRISQITPSLKITLHTVNVGVTTNALRLSLY